MPNSTAIQTFPISVVVLAVSGDQSPQIAERATAVSNYSATGEIGVVAYTLSGVDSALFSIDAQGNLVFQLPPDFELPSDDGTDNAYNVNVVATDDVASVTYPVQVSVLDVYENLPPVVQNQSAEILDNADIGLTVAVLAGVDTEVLSYSIVSGNTGNAFSIVGPTIQVAAPLDFDQIASYSLIIRASDGLLTADFTLTVDLVKYIDLEHPLIDIETLFPEVHAEIPLSSFDLRMFHARHAIIEFCKETYYWQQELEGMALNTLSNRYQIVAPANTVIVDIESIATKDASGSVITMTEGYNDMRQPSFRKLSPTIIEVYNQDNISDALNLTVALQPSHDAAQYSRDIHDRYYETIIAGIKSRLLGMSGETWEDANKSNYYRSVFLNGVANARREVERGYNYQYDPSVQQRRDYF